MQLSTALHKCRTGAASYLAAQAVEIKDAHFWRHSPVHDPEMHPGHLLCGTWAGAHASVLLGLDAAFDANKQRRIGTAINSFQQADGTYLMNRVHPPGGEIDLEYVTLQCTNYALGGLLALGQKPRRELSFLQPLKQGPQLAAWLDRRDLSSPWAEGNNLVNLASFYAILGGQEHGRARLEEMLDWLDQKQQSHTGFWHEGEVDGKRALLIAMAGAAHNLHIYYFLNREVPNATAIIDSCLRLGYLGVRSACVDLDMVDILTNLRRYCYGVTEIDRVLRRYLMELLDVQNADGGFCDNYVTSHLHYGLRTPAGISVTWTTWFRLATIGMIVCTLFPEQRPYWHFRRTLGSGYWNSEFARISSKPSSAQVSRNVPTFTRFWWATKRKQRFARQRLTSSLRETLLRDGEKL